MKNQVQAGVTLDDSEISWKPSAPSDLRGQVSELPLPRTSSQVIVPILPEPPQAVAKEPRDAAFLTPGNSKPHLP